MDTLILPNCFVSWPITLPQEWQLSGPAPENWRTEESLDTKVQTQKNRQQSPPFRAGKERCLRFMASGYMERSMCDACISVRRDYPNESVRLTPYQANSKCFHDTFSIFQDSSFFYKKQFLFLLTSKIFHFFSFFLEKSMVPTSKTLQFLREKFFQWTSLLRNTFLMSSLYPAVFLKDIQMLTPFFHHGQHPDLTPHHHPFMHPST